MHHIDEFMSSCTMLEHYQRHISWPT